MEPLLVQLCMQNKYHVFLYFNFCPNTFYNKNKRSTTPLSMYYLGQFSLHNFFGTLVYILYSTLYKQTKNVHTRRILLLWVGCERLLAIFSFAEKENQKTKNNNNNNECSIATNPHPPTPPATTPTPT